MVAWQIGALVAAAIPFIAVIFALGVNRFKGEVMWVLLPGTVLMVVCALFGGLGAFIFNVWWAGPIAAIICIFLWVVSPRLRN